MTKTEMYYLAVMIFAAEAIGQSDSEYAWYILMGICWVFLYLQFKAKGE